jgi:hypothetical protein
VHFEASIADERLEVVVDKGLVELGLVCCHFSKRGLFCRAFTIALAWGAAAHRRFRESTSFQCGQQHLQVGVGAGEGVVIEVTRGHRSSKGCRRIDAVQDVLREFVED